jgi:adenylosuccinate lyase
MANFAARLSDIGKSFSEVKILGKFSGAVGNYNACVVAYPEIDWPKMTEEFVRSLGLQFNPYVTQVIYILCSVTWLFLMLCHVLDNIFPFGDMTCLRMLLLYEPTVAPAAICIYQLFVLMEYLSFLQIEPHDYISKLFNLFVQFNIVLTDFDRDMWAYISEGYFKQVEL